jgi:Ca-activated chloride channel family protein
LRLSVIAAAVWVVSGSATVAQFTSGVNLVEVYATVTDARGEPITGLTEGDFTVEEDGQPQAITAFAAGRFPLALAIGIDRSFSMSRQRLAASTAAVRRLVEDLDPGDQLMIIAIGSETEVLLPLSVDRGAAGAALVGLDPWGTTPLYDAMLSAIGAIEAASGRRALILLSDGSDRYSAATAGQALEKARRKDVLLYPVALGRARPAVFAELATATGGRSFRVTDLGLLPSTLASIARELHLQYLLGYAPSNTEAGRGTWRSIRVRVNRPGARIRARDGYMVP